MGKHGREKRKHPNQDRANNQKFNEQAAATKTPAAPETDVNSVKARNKEQVPYFNALQDADVKFTFGLGPAGTGKTYLAVAAALKRLEAGDVRSILLVRPALEAGQKIGFLPGSPEEKLAPYYIEIQNIFIEFLGKSKFNSLVNSGAIEFLQPGFIRGRTFKNSYVIVDEAQNFTYGEIKTVASRIGEGSVYCIMGDPDQTDLRPQHLSGLNDFAEAQKINPRNMVFTFMSAKGIERSPECRTIIENCAAYEKSREEQRTTAKPQMNGHDPAPV